MNKRTSQAGFASFEIIAGAIIVSILVSVAALGISFMQSVKAERMRNDTILNPKKVIDNNYNQSEEEFGSYTVTFNL